MAKLTLQATQKAVGIGTFVEKTIKFLDLEGKEFTGEVLVKILTHDEVASATDVWKVKNNTGLTVDQYRKALLHQIIYEDEKTKFFPKITDTGLVSTEVIDALYEAADSVVNFSGKNWISTKEKNSGVSLSSTELVEEQ